jgi:peptide deformylase
LSATGLLARALQHEMDHLDGVLFIDRLRPISRRLIVRRIEARRRRGNW